ncbi:MAG: hypothetical protein AB1576_14010 [Bacillota bacterium]
MSRWRQRCLFLVILSLAYALFSWAGFASPSPILSLEPAERDALSNLFLLLLKMERSRARMDELDVEIGVVQEDIHRLEELLEETEARYREARAKTGTALRWLHRMGPTSYLEVLLGASSLRDFLVRVNLVSSAAKGALRVLAEVQEEKRSFASTREDLDAARDRLSVLEEERSALATAGQEYERGKEGLAASLGPRAPSVFTEMDRLQGAWNSQAKPYLLRLPERLSALMEKGIMPEGVTITPSLFSVRVKIPESGLNAVLAEEAGLKDAAFEFEPGGARLKVPSLDLTLHGSLSVTPQGLLAFSVSQVEFSGLTIRSDPVLEPVSSLSLDLGPSLQGMVPQSISMDQDFIEMTVSLGGSR